jgi:hypothetical protein
MDHQDADPPPRKLTKAECGRLGGLRTKERHGREHYVRAGKLGFAAAARTHAAGNRKYNLDWLRARGKIQPPPKITPEEATALLRALQAKILGTSEDTDHDER